MVRKTAFFAITILLLSRLALADGWIRTFGGERGDGGNWVEVTPDSGYLVAGNMMVEVSRLSLPPGAIVQGSGGVAVYGYILKTNSAGSLLWSRTYPNPGIVHHTRFYCIQQTTDSGYVAVGERTVWGDQVTEHLWLLKLAPDGDTLWTKTYGWPVNGERGYSLRQLPDKGYIITGYTESRFEERQEDLWILRTDSLGDTLWSGIYGDDVEQDWGMCVSLTSDGKYVVTGGYGKERTTWLIKFDEDGSIIWDKTFRIAGENIGKYVEETEDGGFIITGTSISSGRLYVLKTDNQGDSLWCKMYGVSGCKGNCVRQIPDGGYVVCGYRDKTGGLDPPSKAWLLRLDSLGDTVWTRTLNYCPGGTNEFDCFQFTPDGGYILTGETGDNEAERGDQLWLVKADSSGYAQIEEEVITAEPDVCTISSTVDSSLSFNYKGFPEGFQAEVFDASGRKIDVIYNPSSEGTVTWGSNQKPGVYFIREVSGKIGVKKVVLLR